MSDDDYKSQARSSNDTKREAMGIPVRSPRLLPSMDADKAVMEYVKPSSEADPVELPAPPQDVGTRGT